MIWDFLRKMFGSEPRSYDAVVHEDDCFVSSVHLEDNFDGASWESKVAYETPEAAEKAAKKVVRRLLKSSPESQGVIIYIEVDGKQTQQMFVKKIEISREQAFAKSPRKKR
jgi:hypothetical protein